MANRVGYFEIRADNPERAIACYSGLLARQGAAPAEGAAVNAYVCTALVADLDALLAKAPQFGGRIVVPKMPIPGVGWRAYAKDAEGNILGMMQPDPAATGGCPV